MATLTAKQIPNYWSYAEHFALEDHMFGPVDSWTLPSHLYLLSAWSAYCPDPSNPMSCHSDINLTGMDHRWDYGEAPIYAWTDITWLMDQHGVDWPDNDVRFGRFASAAAELAAGTLDKNWAADLVHANDWQAALAPAYLAWKGSKVPSILTIHNLAYQGLFPQDSLRRIGAPESSFHIDGLEFYAGFLDLADGKQWPEARRAAESLGLTIPMLCCSPDFTHPDADCPLGDAVGYPTIRASMGVSDRMDIGGYWTVAPGAK